MHSADYAATRCLSVRLSHAGVVSNEIDLAKILYDTSNFRKVVRQHTEGVMGV